MRVSARAELLRPGSWVAPQGRAPPGNVTFQLMPQVSTGGPGGPGRSQTGPSGPGGPSRAGSGINPLDMLEKDDLNRSDLWDFSAGAMARQGRVGADPSGLPRINSPYHVG